MILVKLGGSVITDKGRYRTFDPDTAGRLAEEIARTGQDVVIVHGAGSFGHILAKEHRLHLGISDGSQLLGASLVMSDVRELDLEVCRRLSAKGVRAVPLPPASCAAMSCKAMSNALLMLLFAWISRSMTRWASAMSSASHPVKALAR
mgnify:CR=1 FL=1